LKTRFRKNLKHQLKKASCQLDKLTTKLTETKKREDSPVCQLVIANRAVHHHQQQAVQAVQEREAKQMQKLQDKRKKAEELKSLLKQLKVKIDYDLRTQTN
jgi:hypothetical protein